MWESVVEVLEQGAEVLASFTGDHFPIFSVAAQFVKLALGNVESEEATYTKEQLQRVQDRLEAFSEEMQQTYNEILRIQLDEMHYEDEENITNQYRKFKDIFIARPEYWEKRKELFLDHFSKTGGDRSLMTLYDSVTGDNSILEKILKYEEKSRRPVEDFCAQLKKLFSIGIIALLGHAALKGYNEEDALLKEWGEKMKVVQEKMDAVILECIESFPKQAELDAHRLVSDHPELTNQQLADAILEKLKKKYDWVGWSVRVVRAPSWLFYLFNKKNSHCPTEKSRFQVQSSDKKVDVWVSYSSSQEPVDKNRIQQLVQGQKRLSVKSLATFLFENLPGDCVVHTVKISKDVGFSSSFPDELHYWEEHEPLYVCVHSS